MAQAGNVAVPAAARDHFLLDADRVAGGSDKTIAGNGAPGGKAQSHYWEATFSPRV